MARDPSLPPEELALTDASVQEIQLELIRRRRFNAFEGPKIVASLRRHRSLWRSLLMDRAGIPGESGLGALSLIKLRDLPFNSWSVDTLYVLCDSRSDAERLKKVAEDEEWQADAIEIYSDPKVVDRALGVGGSETSAIIEMWWD